MVKQDGSKEEKACTELTSVAHDNNSGGKNFSWRRRYLFLAIAAAAIVCLLTVVFVPNISNYTSARQVEKLLSLGEKHLLDSNFELALTVFDEALAKDDTNIPARLGKAKSLVGLNRFEEAETYLEEIIRLNSALAEAHVLLVQVKVQLEHIAGALHAISQGEKRVGKEAFTELCQKLDSQISIRTDVLEVTVWEEITANLFYKEQLLKPQWSVDNSRANLEQQADGTAKISNNTPGEVKLTAKIGPITQEATLTFVAIDWAKKADLLIASMWDKGPVEFLKSFSYPEAIPPFLNPNELDDAFIIWHTIHYLKQESDWTLEHIPAESLQRGAQKIFGPEIKEVVPQAVKWLEWDPETGEYYSPALGLNTVYRTYILDYTDTEDQYIVDVVHLRVEGAESPVLNYYDDNNEHLGEFGNHHWTDHFDTAEISKLPRRRYIFTKLADGGYYLAQSIKVNDIIN